MKAKGFTLIELLVAVSIFSLIMALSAFAFRFYVGLAKKLILPYPEEAERFTYLDDAIKNIMYFVGTKSGTFGKNRFFYYFYGANDNLKFVSLSDGKPVLCKIYVKDHSLFIGKSPVYSRLNNYKDPYFIPQLTKTWKLLGNVNRVHFSYCSSSNCFSSMKEEIPNFIKLSFYRNGKPRIFYFKVASDFKEGKGYAVYFSTYSKE